ncbi:MAG: hypothetical protein ACT4RN_20250 [Pseudonocardia sp.]
MSERKVLASARGAACAESGWLVFLVAVTGFVVWVALVGVAGVASGVWWFLAGALFADAVTLARQVAGAWREVQVLGTCPGCRAAAVGVVESQERRLRCVRSGHRQVTR